MLRPGGKGLRDSWCSIQKGSRNNSIKQNGLATSEKLETLENGYRQGAPIKNCITEFSTRCKLNYGRLLYGYNSTRALIG